MSDQPYTDDQLAAAASQVQPPPVGTTLGDIPPGAAATEVDVPALLARLMAQQEAMAAEIARLRADRGPEGEHNLIGASIAARDLIAQHFEFHPKRKELERLAEDMIDAARNSVASGDTGPVRAVAQRLSRALGRFHPGPGDHHYFDHALRMTDVHVPDAADTVTAPQPSNAPAVSGGKPASVVAGSVTG